MPSPLKYYVVYNMPLIMLVIVRLLVPSPAYRPYLTCTDVDHIRPVRMLMKGTVKNIWLVEWNHHLLVMSRLAHPQFAQDFQSNLANLQFFGNDPRVINLLGHCGTSTIFTEFHPHGNAFNVHRLRKKNNLEWCIDYVEIIELLHSHGMVMCDSNSVGKTLSQYLVTDGLRLILNDCDALPRVTPGHGIRCGPRPLTGDLVAPEQRTLNDSHLPLYDGKTDIWKIPDVCFWLLGEQRFNAFGGALLHWIHSKSKSINPQARPTASHIVQVYRIINQHFVYTHSNTITN